jgi:hypothetical protein
MAEKNSDSWAEFEELKSLAKLDEIARSLPSTEKKRLYQVVLEIAEQIATQGKISGAGGIRVGEYLQKQLAELRLRADCD